jgi:hypothetical protein
MFEQAVYDISESLTSVVPYSKHTYRLMVLFHAADGNKKIIVYLYNYTKTSRTWSGILIETLQQK